MYNELKKQLDIVQAKIKKLTAWNLKKHTDKVDSDKFKLEVEIDDLSEIEDMPILGIPDYRS